MRVNSDGTENKVQGERNNPDRTRRQNDPTASAVRSSLVKGRDEEGEPGRFDE